MDLKRKICLEPTHENVVVDGILRYPDTGLKVLVVGAGPGGLMTALEFWRKGHTVEILEKANDISPIGDAIFLSPSGVCGLHKYPKLMEAYPAISRDIVLTIRQWTGECIVPPYEWEWNRHDVPQHVAWPMRIRTMVERAPFSLMLYKQCERLGIKTTFGVNIVDYVESTDAEPATVISENGIEYIGDIVVAADGLGTKSHNVVLGKVSRAYPTGFQIARVMYHIDETHDAPMLNQLKGSRSDMRIYSGRNFHCIAAVADDIVVIGLTTPDNGIAAESWAQGISAEEMLSRLPAQEDLDPILPEIIRSIPHDKKVVSWKLCWRDPQSSWTSPGGRIVQLGDSAHAFIPSSTMGAVAALEDAMSLAECLRLAGRGNPTVGTKVHELLRLQRVAILQRTGFANRREAHQDTGMEGAINDAIDNDPLRIGKWVWTHHAEKYVSEKFAEAKAHLMIGAPFQNSNIPEGFVWDSDWSMEKELEAERQRIPMENIKRNGDWGIY
ncbi:hypothetical protein PFICI_11716 [Pestalotiopsis fici W106-1]|uniref:FAD-binding domain-containing protein n=1 Tax=Pestalotiopsis fici (strain W106-1 / CGMCC3.15140) TaxID=1229662 RepID=W3WR66_PESFW|nr:uncharacterized protein PFICI_11716 [Pestalotiopsis fici W106-1]ETS76329.1 hypothetical protein PFICI_11716 [Pestalotiopsis fici W106-1]